MSTEKDAGNGVAEEDDLPETRIMHHGGRRPAHAPARGTTLGRCVGGAWGDSRRSESVGLVAGARRA